MTPMRGGARISHRTQFVSRMPRTHRRTPLIISASKPCLTVKAADLPPEMVSVRTARATGATVLGLGLAILAGTPDAWAVQAGLAEYQGTWVLDGRGCADVYASDGKATAFKKPVDIFAPAFIISGRRLRAPMASCQIKSVRPVGDRQLLLLDCMNAVAGNEVRILHGACGRGSQALLQ